MKLRIISIIGALALTALVSPASAAPEWCKLPAAKGLRGDLRSSLHADPSIALEALVGATCTPGNDPDTGGKQTAKTAALIDEARAKWSTRLAMTEADWADVVVWANMSLGQRNSPTLLFDRKMAWTKLPPIDVYIAMLDARDPHYMADALGAQLNEVGRLGYISRCLDSAHVGDWAMCQPDLEAFDLAKFATQLREDKASTPDGYHRTLIRIALHKLLTKMADRTAAVAKLKAKDPGYAALFDLAASTRKAWTATPPDAKLLDLVGAMDAAWVTNSNSAFAGCQDTTWEALATVISSISAQAWAKVPDAAGHAFVGGAVDPITRERNGYLAAVAYYRCQNGSGKKVDLVARSFGHPLRWAPGFRGPRNAASTAMRKSEIKLDDRDARIQYSEVNRNELGFADDGNMSGGGDGVVSAVKPEGDMVRIAFVKKMVKLEVCDEWQDTNKFSGFEAGGAIRYEKVCKKRKFENVNQAPDPQTVDKRFAAGVKKGVYVSVLETIVETVRTKPGGPPTYVFGAPVK